MAQADKTAEIIRSVTPFMMLLILAVAGRIVCDAFLRVFFVRAERGGQAPQILYSVDVFLTLCFFFGFLGLVISHFIVRAEENFIQQEARSHEQENLAASRSSIGAPREPEMARVQAQDKPSG
jgi:hypothetical protein